MQLTKKKVVEQIKIIRDILDNIYQGITYGNTTYDIIRSQTLNALQELAQLETGMQPTVNELSQVKPSIWKKYPEEKPIGKFILAFYKDEEFGIVIENTHYKPFAKKNYGSADKIYWCYDADLITTIGVEE